MTSGGPTTGSLICRTWPLRCLLALALVAGLAVIGPLAAGRLATPARADGPQPVSGAFNLGGGLSGQVDERTGQFSVSVPLVSVPSVGDSDVSFSLSWVQARAGAGVDRMGWGGGWSLGTSYVNTNGGVTLYTASGGSYQTETDGLGQFSSGLENYVLADVTFAVAGGTLPARPPAVPAAVAYAYTLGYDDGKVDYFDTDGNLVARVDRFGNRTDLQWQQAGTAPNGDLQFEPTAIVDAYGLVTSFAYGNDDDGNSQVTVSSPRRSDGVVATTTIDFNPDDSVHAITDPVGRQTSFDYQQVAGAQLITTVTGPSQAQTQVSYQSQGYPDDDDPTVTLVWAATLDVLASDGATRLSPQRRFDIDPAGNPNDQNYAGNPGYLSTSTDALFASGDSSYVYQTSISTDATSTVSTYDSAHRLIERTVQLTPAGDDPVLVQDQQLCYPALVDVGSGVSPPANYTNPTNLRVTRLSRSGPNGPTGPDSPTVTGQSWCPSGSSGPSTTITNGRTVTSATQFDDHGRMVSATDESGVTTTTAYDAAYGLPTKVVTSAGGTVLREIDATLTGDKKSILNSTQSDANGTGQLSARSTQTYTYDGAGRPTSQTTTWAGTPPADNGGPASTTTAYASTFAGPTRTLTITSGAGTPQATTTTTVIDLVSGQPVKTVDGAGRVTTRTFDAANRIRSVTPPTGLTTTTTYQNATDTSDGATTTVAEADGHVTTTTYDALSRVLTVTDNVRNGAFVSSPAARTVTAMSYSTDGSTLTATDRLGRTTTTTSDAVGRMVSRVGATGMTTTTTYDDVANTTTERSYGKGASTPSEITGTTYDAANRIIAARTSYPVTSRTSLVDPAHQTSYDGLGRITTLTAADTTAVPDFAGPGGVPVTTTVGPAKTARNTATPVLATDTTQLSGDVTARSLTYASSGSPAQAGTQLTVDAVGNVATATDGLGQATGYGYAGDGRPVRRTDPDGTVSLRTYDPTTGQLTSISSTTSAGASVRTSYTYVLAGKPGAGLVRTATNESGTITYGYDADRNRTSASYPDGSSVSYDYTDGGLLHTMTDITGAVTTYTYNSDGTMSSATQARGSATLASVVYGYDGLRRVTTTTRGNGLVTTNTYTPNNLLATQNTVDKNKAQVEAHSYAYDNHHNLVRRTDSTAKPSSCVVLCGAGPSTYGTYTTTYRYDAYDRLTGSAVYNGGQATGTPVTQQTYALDVSGNITTATRTTTLTSGGRPSTATQTTVNTYDRAAQLTGQTVGSTAAAQTLDPQGRITTSLAGSTTSYRPDGLPATVRVKGVTTTFSYWPDGTRKRSVTTGGPTGTTAVDYHYGVDGSLVNDTTTQSGSGSVAGSASASYLLTAGREARTIVPGTTGAGKPAAGAKKLAASVTTGSGVGYFLRDRHSSVTALVDSGGAVTNTYAYGDWGAPALLDGRSGTVTGAVAGTAAGTTNPLQYAGAAGRAMYTDVGLGTMMLPSRFYDPRQARFTSRDVADAHNLYLGFDGNPIMNLDPSGQSSTTDTILDALYIGIFLISAIVSGGAAVAAYGAVVAATEITAAVVVPVVASAVAIAANLVGMMSNVVRFADDLEPANKKFLSDDQRSDLSNIATIAGSIAGAAGGVADFAADGAKTASSAAQLLDDSDESESASIAVEDDAPVPANDRSTQSDDAASDLDEPTNMTNTKAASPVDPAPGDSQLPTSSDQQDPAPSSSTALKKAQTTATAVQTATTLGQSISKQVRASDPQLSQIRVPRPDEGDIAVANRWQQHDSVSSQDDDPRDLLVGRSRTDRWGRGHSDTRSSSNE